MAHILVVGNINADRIVRLRGPWSRGDDIAGEDMGLRLGGAAANAASALCLAGHAVVLMGCIGSDLTGDRLVEELARWPWDTQYVTRQPGSTAQCLILIEPDGERTIVSLRGHYARPTWPAPQLDAIAAVYIAAREQPPAELFAAIRARGIPLVWQLRLGQRPAATPDLIVGAEAALGNSDPWAALQDQGLECGWLVLTRGAAGAIATNGKDVVEVASLDATVVDATGAGDAFAAGLVHGVAGGLSVPACLDVAAAWGAMAVAHMGSTASPAIADWAATQPAVGPNR